MRVVLVMQATVQKNWPAVADDLVQAGTVDTAVITDPAFDANPHQLNHWRAGCRRRARTRSADAVRRSTQRQTLTLRGRLLWTY
jgi:hypothetical protein